MLAGWLTLEARLATALLLLLVFAAGMRPTGPPVHAQLPIELNPHPYSPAQTVNGLSRGEAGKPASETATPLWAGSAATPMGELNGSVELGLLNQDRLQAGVPPLAESTSLDRIASIRATQVISDGITHVRPGHSTLAAVELMRASGIPYVWHGENIIWEGGMPMGQVPGFFNDWWMASSAHRANILNPNYRSVGIGVAQSGDRIYMVEVFSDTPTLAVPLRQASSRQTTRPR